MSVSRLRSLGRYAVVAALIGHVVMFVWVVAGRIAFPLELEWMTGSIFDHVERVRAGRPIYVEPSDGFIPFLYPPLYYWTCALLGGSAVACRLVSLVSLAAQLALAGRIARHLGASPFWSWGAAGMVLACFRYVGWWYDLERADGLCAALVVAAAAIVVRARSVRGAALGGVVLALACLAKQQAVFYAAGAGLGLLLAGGADRWRRASSFAASFAASVAALFAIAIRRESSWLVYYVLGIPRGHGVLASLAPVALRRDLGLGFLLVAATAGAAALLALRAERRSSEWIVFASMLLAGFAAAVSSRLHIGGWVNVLMPWTTFAAIAVAVTASELERAPGSPRVLASLTPFAVFVQLAIWSYAPGDYCPIRASLPAHRAFAERVARLEASGEVLIPATGHVTTPRRFHISALADVARVEGRSPAALVEKLRARAYVAIVDGARLPEDPTPDPDWPPVLLEDLADLKRPLLEGYFVAERLADASHSRALLPPMQRVWLYLPRRVPLVGASAGVLRARQVAEMRIALARQRAGGEETAQDPRDVEELAARDVLRSASTTE